MASSFHKNVDDLRDDLNDSWGAEPNRRQAVVTLGERGVYSAQVSHHFSQRNVVVASLRNVASEEWH